MKKLLRFAIFLMLAMTIIGLAGCVATEKDFISMNGIVKLINLKRGFYGIVGDDSKNYEVSNLSQEFQVDGLRVEFEAKLRRGVATIHMWGIPVEIIKIELCYT